MAKERILVIDDEPDIRELVSDILEDEGFVVDVAEDAQAARQKMNADAADLVLLDIWMPGEDGISLLKDWQHSHAISCPVVMMSGHGTVETAVEATKLGAYGFIEKPLTTAKLLNTIREALDAESIDVHSNAPLREPQVVGTSSSIRFLIDRYENIAKTNSWVVLSGEPGSGRTLGARYIHSKSTRAQQPFVNVSHMEFEQMLSSDSKTSIARSFKSLIHAAREGCLYFQSIDEISEAKRKLALQALKSLRANQEQFHSEIRFICSIGSRQTNNPGFQQMLGILHSDCLMVEVQVPSLRDHSEDIPELLHHYVDQLCAREDFPYRKFSIAAQNRLLHHDWPGNVNELKSLVQTVLLNGGDDIEVAEIEKRLKENTLYKRHAGGAGLTQIFDLPLREAREAFEKEYLLRQLKISGGSVSRLAERVGMERTHLYRKLRSLGIGSKEAS